MVANAGTKKHGKGGSIWVVVTAGTSAVRVALKSEWTLNLNRDYVDATVFGDTNKTYLAGLKDVSGTYAGLLDNSGDLLVNATDVSDGLMTYLYSDTTVLIGNGMALHDSAINCSNTDAVRVSGNMRANGPWTIFAGA
jgi:hypothetical protein